MESKTYHYTGDAYGWTRRAVFWGREIAGRVREEWNAFVLPYMDGGPGRAYTREPSIYRKGGFIIFEQSGGIDC